ncbi:helix-turn-helix domain-containing protein [Ectobacillus ponti]|uniref:Helix-turn-helix domain-containing protein n=1 Tax=Ectobacillus ponti TaxID=2961894 RepID=A0AA41XCV5_9BACI|nr:helix-turn-helix domain-containing protein [Ectobacillus ponti]MCP8970538.1 helix-turn-helix domain-containing protein [Ectobacillus ponti]
MSIEETIRAIVREEQQKFLEELKQLLASQQTANKVLKAKEAAAYLNISQSRIYDLAHSEGFPVIWEGRKMLFLQKDLDAWLETQKEA